MSKSTADTNTHARTHTHIHRGIHVPELPLGISLSGFQGYTVHGAHRKRGHNPLTTAAHCN